MAKRNEANSERYRLERERDAEAMRERIRLWRVTGKELPWGAEHSDIWNDDDRALAIKREANKIEIWREQGGISGYDLPGTFLRLNDDTIETSKGANFPVAHGKLAWAIVERCQRSQTAWRTNGHTIHLGSYKLDSIDANGTVNAGCHRVPFAEIERIAKELGLCM
jgi:hypothetical protein